MGKRVVFSNAIPLGVFRKSPTSKQVCDFSVHVQILEYTEVCRDTVDHEIITEFREVLFTGLYKRNGWHGGGGHFRPALPMAVELYLPGVDAHRIYDLWTQWHMSSMVPQCVHMKPLSACPTTAMFLSQRCFEVPHRPPYTQEGDTWHYACGRYWLCRPLPLDVQYEIMGLFAQKGVQ